MLPLLPQVSHYKSGGGGCCGLCKGRSERKQGGQAAAGGGRFGRQHAALAAGPVQCSPDGVQFSNALCSAKALPPTVWLPAPPRRPCAGEAEAHVARLREQLQGQEGRASALAAQLDEAQRQQAAWQVGGCCRGLRAPFANSLGCATHKQAAQPQQPLALNDAQPTEARHARPCMRGSCRPWLHLTAPRPHVRMRSPMQGQAAELEGATRTMEGLVERMFATAGGQQAELADAARVLEGQAAEVRHPSCATGSGAAAWVLEGPPGGAAQAGAAGVLGGWAAGVRLVAVGWRLGACAQSAGLPGQRLLGDRTAQPLLRFAGKQRSGQLCPWHPEAAECSGGTAGGTWGGSTGRCGCASPPLGGPGPAAQAGLRAQHSLLTACGLYCAPCARHPCLRSPTLSSALPLSLPTTLRHLPLPARRRP